MAAELSYATDALVKWTVIGAALGTGNLAGDQEAAASPPTFGRAVRGRP